MPLVSAACWALATVLAATVAPPPPGPADAGDGGRVDAAEREVASGTAAADASGTATADGDAALVGTEDAVRTTAAAPTTPVAAAPAPKVTAPLHLTALEKGTRRRLSGVRIRMDAESVGETDADGRFDGEFSLGHHLVQLQLARFELLQQPVDLDWAGATVTVRLLQRQEDRAYVSVVSAAVSGLATPRYSVSGEEARSTPGTMGDPIRVLESLPGVAQVSWPLALYAIRGANPGNTGFFLDGMRIPALFHFLLGPSIIHPYLISHLDFYPGGYPAQFGGYASGIVAAQTTAPPADLAHASVDIRLYDAGILVTSPWDGGRGTIAVGARYAYSGLLAPLFFPDVKLAYGDYMLRAEHPWLGGRATLMALGSFDSLDIKFKNIGDGALQFHRVDVRWERAAGPGRLRLRTILGTDWARSNIENSPITIRAYSFAPHLEYVVWPTAWSRIEAGVSGEGQRLRPNVPLDPRSTDPGQGRLDDLARSRQAATLGAHVSAKLTLGQRLEISPGFRFAQYFEQGVMRSAAEPRIAARVHLGRGLAVKAAAGRTTQMASLPVGVPGFDAFDLRDLGLQRSTQGSLGVEAQIREICHVDVTGFYQQLLVSDLRSTFSTDLRRQDLLEMRTGRGYGVELLVRRDPTERLHGWLAYTLSRSERDVGGVTGPSDWDQRHILNLLANYRLKGGYSLGGRFHLHSGRPYAVQIAPNDVEYLRLPAFYQLDLRADRRIAFDRFFLTVYAELGNATLDREVTDLYSAKDPFGAPRPGGNVHESGFRLVLPSLGVRAEF